jgi:hypothetical protein
MRPVLRSGALVEAWFDMLPEAPRELARQLREAILLAEPTLEPAIKWGNLVFSLKRDHALAIAVYRDHVNLQVFNGGRLLDRHPELAGTGRGLRHLRLVPGEPVPGNLVARLTLDCVDELRRNGRDGAGGASAPPQ